MSSTWWANWWWRDNGGNTVNWFCCHDVDGRRCVDERRSARPRRC